MDYSDGERMVIEELRILLANEGRLAREERGRLDEERARNRELEHLLRQETAARLSAEARLEAVRSVLLEGRPRRAHPGARNTPAS